MFGRASSTTAAMVKTTDDALIQIFHERSNHRGRKRRGREKGTTAIRPTGIAQNAETAVALLGPYSTPGVVTPWTSGRTDTASRKRPRPPSSASSVWNDRRISSADVTTQHDAAITTIQNSV